MSQYRYKELPRFSSLPWLPGEGILLDHVITRPDTPPTRRLLTLDNCDVTDTIHKYQGSISCKRAGIITIFGEFVTCFP